MEKPVDTLVKFYNGSRRCLSATNPNKMNNTCLREIDNLPTLVPHAPAPIGIFPVHKEMLVQRAYILQRLSANHHTGA